MNVLLRAALPLTLSCSLFAACGSEGEDLDLETLPVVNPGDEKSDSTSSPTFFWVRPTATSIACIAPPCPKAEVTQVNTPNAQPIYKFDWRGLKLTSAQQKETESQLGSLMLLGKLTTATAYNQKVKVLQVTRATQKWSVGASDDPRNDQYYSVKAINNPSCSGMDCPTLEINMLGNGIVGPIQITSANLNKLSQSQTTKDALVNELKAGTAYISTTSIKNLVANVSEVFRPLGAAPLK
jgi:hypothetical protein